MPTQQLVPKMKGVDFALLAIGAIAGAYLRYKIVESPVTIGALPVNVLIVNVLGSFLLGIFSVISLAFNLDTKYTLFFAVGFCGSFTTMSSFELETVNLVDAHRLGLAALEIVSNVGLAFIAVITGRILGNFVLEHII
ncbi:MAG: fluoride efflux transporter CrcB [Candidatus Bathyarchaeota archaeon]|nr:fluoride efflux transporter CrcB [Candidatus Bathyarchaeota archaeon]